MQAPLEWQTELYNLQNDTVSIWPGRGEHILAQVIFLGKC